MNRPLPAAKPSPEEMLVSQVAEKLRSAANPRQALELIAYYAARLLGASKTSIHLSEDGSLRPYARFVEPGGLFDFRRAASLKGIPLPEESHPLMYEVLRSGRPHIGLRHSMHGLPGGAGRPGGQWPGIFFIVEPLRLDGQVVGVMAINLRREDMSGLRRAETEALQRLLELAGEALKQMRSSLPPPPPPQAVEAARAASQEPLRLEQAVLEGLHEAVLAINSDSRIIYANPAAIRTFGYSAAQLLSMHIGELAAYTEEDRRMLAEVCATGTPSAEREMEYRTAGGQVVYGRRRLCPLKDHRARPVGVVALIRDVSAIRRLQGQAAYLAERLDEMSGHGLVGVSRAMREVMRQVELVARTDSTVLILGETGTGKELVARAIHEMSPRRSRPMVKVHCAALSPGLIESEFFGHEKGAFTGATGRKTGRFELADGGTILLDEVGDVPLETQVKLLRVLQEREFERVGGTRTIRVDVRVVAATNRDMQAAVEAGTFRRDLYYRLNVFPICIPPLRQRIEVIPVLATHFAYDYARAMGRQIEGISPESIRILQSYDWPGNVRELRNVIERAVITSPGPLIELRHLEFERPGAPEAAGGEPMDLASAERRHILETLERTGWRIAGAGGAADVLKVKASTLRSRMKKLGIERPPQ